MVTFTRALAGRTSDVTRLHRLQFDGGESAVAEVLEPRLVDDTSSERRWPTFWRRVRQLPGAAAAHRQAASGRPRASCTPNSASRPSRRSSC